MIVAFAAAGTFAHVTTALMDVQAITASLQLENWCPLAITAVNFNDSFGSAPAMRPISVTITDEDTPAVPFGRTADAGPKSAR